LAEIPKIKVRVETYRKARKLARDDDNWMVPTSDDAGDLEAAASFDHWIKELESLV
jgi:hypothetical protein